MNRPSLRAAINAMCKSCIYDPGSGNGAWREQVQRCSSSNCALHAVRPLPLTATKTRKDARGAASAPITPEGDGTALSGPRIGLNGVIVEERRAA